MKNHNLRMIIGCVVPLLLIFSLPVFGATGGWLTGASIASFYNFSATDIIRGRK